jgi:outer membrane lipoprotein-sorting protein
MKTFKAIALVMSILLILATACAETSSKTQQVLDDIAKKTKGIKSYRLKMRMETSMMGQPMITEGEMAFKSPNKMHMTTKSNMMGGALQEIIASGDVVWTYMPAMKMVTKMDLARIKAAGKDKFPGAASDSNIMNSLAAFSDDKIRFIEEKNTDEGKVYVLEADPDLAGKMPADSPLPQMLPDKMVFWISQDTGMPVKIIMMAEDGSVMTEQTYSDFRLNVDIDDSEFEFTPPEGTQVMDMTESALGFIEQMQ